MKTIYWILGIIVLIGIIFVAGYILIHSNIRTPEQSISSGESNVVDNPDSKPQIIQQPNFNNYCDVVIKGTDLANLCGFSAPRVNIKNKGYSEDSNIFPPRFKTSDSGCTYLVSLGDLELMKIGGKDTWVYPSNIISVYAFKYKSNLEASSAFDIGTKYVSVYNKTTLDIGDKSLVDIQNNYPNTYVDILLGDKWIQINYIGSSCSKDNLVDLAKNVVNNLKT